MQYYQCYQLRERSHSLHTLTALRTEADCFMLRKAQAAALRKLARTPCTPALISCVYLYP
ncbi:MAG: hypothetical protein M3O33_21405 [Cyanobacteriota bacterium]|nr:hypothetical protein [Cyanobacteriota bacterium]